MAATFRFLHARGVSYGAIAALVGVSPNRAAEITKGTRQVTAYDVLERIAVGLSIPRPWMGLGQDGPGDTEPAFGRFIKAAADFPSAEESTGGCSDEATTALTRLRTGLDEALASSTVTPRQLDLIEESTGEHMRIYPAAPPRVMLSRLAAECAEVQVLSRRRQPAAVQARLSGTAALLATMCADALMRLGDVGEARLWYRTAMHAADDSSDSRLRVLVRAQAAMLPYYFGDPRQTVVLTEAALAVTAAPSSSAALASAGRARALARLGSAEEARKAIVQARQLFDQVGDDESDTAFRFPMKRMLLYLSGASTWLGDTAEAYRVQDEALRLYRASPSATIDPTLLALDRSMCLAHDRRPAEAAASALEALVALPEAQRTEIVLTKASDLVSATPMRHGGSETAELTDYVRACREHARTLTTGTAVLDP
jgi:tetratricopeptide (TPR) repeat protein